MENVASRVSQSSLPRPGLGSLLKSHCSRRNRPIPRERPGNERGSLDSTSGCTNPTACATLTVPARRIGATLGSDPERRGRASGAEAEHESSASAPATFNLSTGPKRKTQAPDSARTARRNGSNWTYAQPCAAHNPHAGQPIPAWPLGAALSQTASQQMDIFPEQLADIIPEQ